MQGSEIKEDRALLERLREGNTDALRPIYEKYKTEMLAVALALAPDRPTAEDVVHDVFVSFAGVARSLKIRENLKSYLLTCIANRVRNIQKAGNRHIVSVGNTESADPRTFLPDQPNITAQESERLLRALATLPESQRDVIILHLLEGLRFRTIAKSQGESINTIQSRYRYGMRKMRAFIAGENENV
jgi:RNA polymerase sigma-70 factor (ECF subfamily)